MEKAAHVIIAIAVCLALGATAREAWKRCITANWANLTEQDHRDRANTWQERMRGCMVVGFSYGSTFSIAFILTRNVFWAVWVTVGLSLDAVFFCLMLFPLQLHRRHQKLKSRPSQTTMAGKQES